jgi:hypothetical protein
MSLNRRQQLDYNQKYQVQSARVNFAHYAQVKQEIEDGKKIGLNIFPPDNDASIVSYISEGEVNTTPEELNRYLGIVEEIEVPVVVPPPGAPTNLVATGRNESAVISFTAGSGTITNYEYLIVDLSGGSFIPFDPPQNTSPVFISGLTNGSNYNIKIRAVNSEGVVSAESDPVTVTPIATTVSFTSVGATTWTAPSDVLRVIYLIVAGGGGGGGGYDSGGGGGGGGGMVLTGQESITPSSTYQIEVGSGGAASTNNYPTINETDGGVGGNSSFNTLIATGGDGGKRSRFQTGGSGLGGAAQNSNITSARGGNGGGANGGGGGGGGATGAGGNKSGSTPGNGGSGLSSTISGTPVTYGVGGRGAVGNFTATGTNGAINTGNGGNGGGNISGGARNGGAGGSGIVIITY